MSGITGSLGSHCYAYLDSLADGVLLCEVWFLDRAVGVSEGFRTMDGCPPFCLVSSGHWAHWSINIRRRSCRLED